MAEASGAAAWHEKRIREETANSGWFVREALLSGLGVALRSTWYIAAELQDGTQENVFIEFLKEVYAANQPSQRLGGGQRAQPASGLMKGNGAKSVKTASLRKSIGNKTRKNDSAAGPG